MKKVCKSLQITKAGQNVVSINLEKGKQTDGKMLKIQATEIQKPLKIGNTTVKLWNMIRNYEIAIMIEKAFIKRKIKLKT